MADNRAYLGDSVYADFDGFMIKLYTNNGCEDENIIWLEPDVVTMLLGYIKRVVDVPQEEGE
jgi:hypothetical protein